MELYFGLFVALAVICLGASIMFFILWIDEKEYADLLKRVNEDYVKKWIEWEKGPKKTKSGIPIPPPALLGVDRF